MKNVSDECMQAVNAILAVYGIPELMPGHIVETHLGYYLARVEKTRRTQEKRHPAGGWDDATHAQQVAKWERLRAGRKVFLLAGSPRYFLGYCQDGISGDALMRVVTLWGIPETDAVRGVAFAWDGRYRIKPIADKAWEAKALHEGRRCEALLEAWGGCGDTEGSAGMDWVSYAPGRIDSDPTFAGHRYGQRSKL